MPELPGTSATPHRPFGEHFTPHMVVADWSDESGWSEPVLRPFEDLPMSPAMVGLHYGQVVFEGLKAYRRENGSLDVFRPDDHAARFSLSARRLAIPELPQEFFLRAVDALVSRDGKHLPPDPGLSLYLRPVLYATEAHLALRPARAYRFLLIAFVTGGFFSDTPAPVSVWVSRDHSRAVRGGTGGVKFAGNYAPSYLAQEKARAAGCDQVVWLDPAEQRWVEELGGMNLFFVRGTGTRAELVTPPLTDTILPGITRDTLSHLAAGTGHQVREERVSVRQWKEECRAGVITETFACGTAAAVTPVGTVRDGEDSWLIGSGEPGPFTLALRTRLAEVHAGRHPVPGHWFRTVPADDSARQPM